MIKLHFDAKKQDGILDQTAVWSGMTAEEVKALPIEQKIRIMEAIWEDFRDRFERVDVSQQQKDLLDSRRARVREGAAQLLDWESVKGSIGRS